MLALEPGNGTSDGASGASAYPKVEVAVFGGQMAGFPCPYDATGRNQMSGRTSYRMAITWTSSGDGFQYEWSPWVEEDMVRWRFIGIG
jgi:hypothetical protein